MKITLGSLTEMLRKQYPSIQLSGDTSKLVSGLRIFHPDKDHKDTEMLYFCPDEYAAARKPAGLAYLFLQPEEKKTTEVTCLHLHHDTDTLALIETVQNIFQRYVLWENQLMRSVAQDRSIQALVDLSGDIFNNPIIVYDNSFHLLGADASQNEYMNQFWTRLAGRWYLAPEGIATTREIGLVEHLKQTDKAAVFSGFNTPVLACGISTKEGQLGFLTVPLVRSTFAEYQLQLAETLALYISQVMERNLVVNSWEEIAGTIIPVDLLKGVEKFDALFMKHQLNLIGWQQQGNYQVLSIQPDSDDGEFTRYIPHCRNSLKQFFSNSYTLVVDRKLVTILNQPKLLAEKEPHMQAFKLFLEGNRLHCGCSMGFHNFKDIAAHYIQAQQAIILSEKRFTAYEDLLAEHILQHFCQSYQSEQFLHPAVQQLCLHDSEGILQETLFQYLISDRSYAASTDALHVHKSTLKYRLDRIRELVGDDCFQPQERLNMLLSLQLSRNKRF